MLRPRVRATLSLSSLLLCACPTDPGEEAGEESPGTSTSGDTDDTGVSEACAELFTDKGSFACGASFDAACEALAATPDQPVSWIVAWAETPPTAEQLECAQAWLDAKGLQGPANDSLGFPVEASYAQIETLCRAQMIGVCEPSALPGTCAGLSQADCEANPLCGDILGTRVPAGEMCQDPGLWAGCISAAEGCPAVEVVAEDEQGDCWIFPSGCLPSEGFSASDSCPDSSVTDGYPACGG